MLFRCSIEVSEAVALTRVRKESTASLIKRRNVLDIEGLKIGERVLAGGPSTEATIAWNEAAQLFYIQAPSVADAIKFENSKAWVGRGCMSPLVFAPKSAAEQALGADSP